MNAKNDLFFVIAVLGILAVAWFSSGGPERRIADRDSFFDGYSAGGTNSSQIRAASDIERKITELEREFEDIRERIVDASQLQERSPYVGMVELQASDRGVEAFVAASEYVTLVASRRNTSAVPITGWRLESLVSNRSATIERGARLPLSGSVNVERDILLEPRQTAVVSSGRSPVGSSFLENACTGYFSQFQTFTPELDRSCPLPREELADFAPLEARTDDICEDHLRSLPRCTVPLSGLPLGASSACQVFAAEELTYNGCVENHRNDEDFYGDEWRIFLGKSEGLWREDKEIIRLSDQDGKTVDLLIY